MNILKELSVSNLLNILFILSLIQIPTLLKIKRKINVVLNLI